MKVIDSAPMVLAALRNGPMLQTDLTEAVWGSSGRGNSTLTTRLFPFCIARGWVAMTTRGRAKLFTLTDLGRKLLGTGDDDANWDYTTHRFKHDSFDVPAAALLASDD